MKTVKQLIEYIDSLSPYPTHNQCRWKLAINRRYVPEQTIKDIIDYEGIPFILDTLEWFDNELSFSFAQEIINLANSWVREEIKDGTFYSSYYVIQYKASRELLAILEDKLP